MKIAHITLAVVNCYLCLEYTITKGKASVPVGERIGGDKKIAILHLIMVVDMKTNRLSYNDLNSKRLILLKLL